MCGHDTENGRVEIGDCMNTRKPLALPMFDKVSFPYPCSSSVLGCLASAADNGYTVRIESQNVFSILPNSSSSLKLLAPLLLCEQLQLSQVVIYCGKMNHQTSIPISDPLRSEA
ncbi:unnamed protein product [Prunus armeniaca]|uniref:Uncharacterized protein n=1 Tax=Prunus armeniaca TaxID=36596 RepID=A0A6J5WUV8_PRUAR|nr:unnamed protein product [Prunus armeniaca]